MTVIDLTTGRRLDGDEMLASLHAKECGCIRMADWVSVVSSRTDGPEPRTRGMLRYGLPELAVSGYSWRHETEWCALLTAVAFRVREEYGEALNQVHNQAVIAGQVPSEIMPTQLEIRNEVGLTGDDVADAYCLPGSFWSRRCGSRWLGSPEWLSETPVKLTVDTKHQQLPSSSTRRSNGPNRTTSWTSRPPQGCPCRRGRHSPRRGRSSPGRS